jgi:hypothetical protein
LITDPFCEEGVWEGAIGYIVEVYNEDAYEVEFSDADGNTIALFAARRDDLTAHESRPALVSA